MMEYHIVGIDEVFDVSSNNITPEETVLEKDNLFTEDISNIVCDFLMD